MNKKIDSIFVSALYYGINKGIVEVMGEGGKVLGRRTSLEMLKLLKDIGLIKENMKDDEIKNLFVDNFGLSEDLIIEDSENEIKFKVVKPTLDLFLQKINEEKIEPFVCPFIHLLSLIYSEGRNYNLMLKEVNPTTEGAEIIFKKIEKTQ